MKIVILNTGCANLFSIKFSIEKIGFNVKISNEKQTILKSDKMILPGVGTAKSAMDQLNNFQLSSLISNYKNPVLGICLGMQILGRDSTEHGKIKTLNIIKQSIRLIKKNIYPIPHMGWNTIDIISKNALLKNISNKSYFYFTHSYIMPINEFTIASCSYGEKFTAVVQKDNFFGVQFHPERSGNVGLQLLKNFLVI